MKGRIAVKFGVPTNGLVLNVPPDQVGPNALINGLNVYVDLDGRLKVRRGPASVTGSALSPVERVIGIGSYEDNTGVFYPVVGTTKRWQALVSGGWSDLNGGTLLNGSINDPVRFTAFASSNKNWIIGANNNDQLFQWNSSLAAYAKLTNSPICKDVATLANRVVAFNTVESGTRYPFRARWSAINDQTTWPALAFADLIDSGNSIVGAALTSQTSLVIYRQYSAWLMQAVPGGDANAFAFERVPAGDHLSGPVGPACIVVGEGAHYYFGIDGRIYMYNGTSISPISDPVDPLLRSTYNNATPSRFHSSYNPVTRQLYFFYARSPNADPNSCIVYDLRRQAFEPLWTYPFNITASGEVREATGVSWNAVSPPPWVAVGVTWTGTGANAIPYASWDAIPAGTQISIYSATDVGNIDRFFTANTDEGVGIGFVASWGLQRATSELERALVHYYEVYQAQALQSEIIVANILGYFQALGVGSEVVTVDSLTMQLTDQTTFYKKLTPGPNAAGNIKSNLLQLIVQSTASGGVVPPGQLNFAGATLFVDIDIRGDYVGGGAQ